MTTPIRKLRVLTRNRSSRQDENDSDSSDEAESEFINEIFKKTWQIHKASPLYGFNYKRSELNRYGRLLTAQIQAEIDKGTGVIVDVEGNIKSTFSVLKGTIEEEDDKPGIKIIVTSKEKNKDVFCGILCRVKDRNESSTEQIDETRLTILPVLLTRGLISLSNYVIKFLQQQFDCYSSHCKFRQNELEWLLTMWPVSLVKPEPIEILFKTASDNLDHISIELDHHTVYSLWKNIHDEDSREFTLEQVEGFIGCIYHHYKEVYRMNLDTLTLSDIKTSILLANTLGKIKIKKRSEVFPILRHITVNCQDFVLPQK